MKVALFVILSAFFLSCGEDTDPNNKPLTDTDPVDMSEDSQTDLGPVCGNGEVDNGEDCDGSIGNESCFTQGYSAGELECGADCKFDVLDCTSKTVYNYMMVQDTSSGQACDSSDPGSDLMYIELIDSSFSTTGWAEAIKNEEGSVAGGKTNDFNNATVLDGNMPDIDGQGCVGFTKDNIFSLGCGGKVLFKFKGSTPAPIPVFGGEHSVLVAEYADECSGSAIDSYDLFGCTDDVDALAGNFDSCTVQLTGRGTGLTNFPVPE